MVKFSQFSHSRFYLQNNILAKKLNCRGFNLNQDSAKPGFDLPRLDEK